MSSETLARSGKHRVLPCLVGVALSALVYIRCRRQSLSNHVGQRIGDLGSDLGHFCPHVGTCSPTHIAMGSLVGSKASLVACLEKVFLGPQSSQSPI